MSPVTFQIILTDLYKYDHHGYLFSLPRSAAQATLAPLQVMKENYSISMKTGGSNDGFQWGVQLTNIRTKTQHFHPVYAAPRKQFRLKICAEYFPGNHFTRISCMVWFFFFLSFFRVCLFFM